MWEWRYSICHLWSNTIPWYGLLWLVNGQTGMQKEKKKVGGRADMSAGSKRSLYFWDGGWGDVSLWDWGAEVVAVISNSPQLWGWPSFVERSWVGKDQPRWELSQKSGIVHVATTTGQGWSEDHGISCLDPFGDQKKAFIFWLPYLAIHPKLCLTTQVCEESLSIFAWDCRNLKPCTDR